MVNVIIKDFWTVSFSCSLLPSTKQRERLSSVRGLVLEYAIVIIFFLLTRVKKWCHVTSTPKIGRVLNILFIQENHY